MSLVDVAGFTQDRGAVVTLQSPEGGTLRATATPIRPKSPVRSALLGTSGADSITGASYVPAAGRFLGVGIGADGVRSVGYTAPVFASGGDATR
ncbi:hypothetical protein AB0L40_04880 [Patulibacter sp. NPDC049589]|uniref:hypothetical protein n=1 Tax=Patulibacter sp. NPDC049589 TaxID=3154731 RepID=UPI0034363145